jgi:integrase
VLTRAIRHPEANDLVRRNVASLIRAPAGCTRGRASRARHLGEAAALLEAARRHRLQLYVVLSEIAVKALREHQERQRQQREIAGAFWQEHGLVFGSKDGTPLDRSYVRRSLRLISRSAGIGEDWAARDLRHTFVSIMSARGDVPVEDRPADRTLRSPHHRNRVPARVAPGDPNRRRRDVSPPGRGKGCYRDAGRIGRTGNSR